MAKVNKLTNYELLMAMKDFNDAYKEENKDNSNAQPVFSTNFEKFLDTINEEVEMSGAQKKPQVANAIINNHLKGI